MTDTARLIYNPSLSTTMERHGSQEDLLFRNESTPWRDWRNWTRSQKVFAGTGAAMLLLLVVSMIGVGIIYGTKSAVIPPPSPAPHNVTTTSTVAPTTTTSTTTKPTTTTSTTTTTEPTTTSTTTKPTTTTSTTTTSTTETPPTTTSTTMKPTTTTTSPTGSTTTWKPAKNPCKQLPENPYIDTAPSLLDSYCKGYVGITYEPEDCVVKTSIGKPVYRNVLTITELTGERTNHTYFADANTKKSAKMAVARIAAEDIFGLNYTGAPGQPSIPPPYYPCVPVPSALESHEDDQEDTTWEMEEETTTYHPSTIRPLPDDPTELPAVTLLNYMRDYLPQNYTTIQCKDSIPPVFRVELTIAGSHSFFADGDTKRHAKERVARAAVAEMFGVDYSKSPTVIPDPAKPCDPVGLPNKPYTDDDEA